MAKPAIRPTARVSTTGTRPFRECEGNRGTCAPPRATNGTRSFYAPEALLRFGNGPLVGGYGQSGRLRVAAAGVQGPPIAGVHLGAQVGQHVVATAAFALGPERHNVHRAHHNF